MYDNQEKIGEFYDGEGKNGGCVERKIISRERANETGAPYHPDWPTYCFKAGPTHA